MIEKSDLIEIGKFQKTHALQGELNALLDVEEDFAGEGYPFVVEMDGIPVPFYPETIRTKGKTSYLVKLEGVDSQEDAQEFVNKEIYARRADLAEYYGDGEDEDGEDLVSEDDLIGAKVVDVRLGTIGELADIDAATANVLMIVRTPEEEDLFIPYVDAFIDHYDPDENTLYVDLPEDLLNLNKRKQDE